MKVLWVDTGPLLDVLILELRESSRGTYERLQGLVGVLTSQARVLAFLDRVSEFGELRYSSGTLVELDRLARTRLPKGRPVDEPMQAFWSAFNTAIPSRLRRPLNCHPLNGSALGAIDVARFGPVDAHLLAAMQENTETHLVTIDRRLRGVAADRSPGRAFFPV